MARVVRIVLEADDRGTAAVKRFSGDFVAAADKINKGAGDAFGQRTLNVGHQLDRLTSRIVKWGTISASIFAGLAPRSILRTGVEFEKTMSGVQALTGATGQALDQLTEQAEKLGAATVFTATQAGEAMYELGRAGFDAQQIMQVMPQVMDLAAAGTLGMAEAAQVTANVIRGMGIPIEQFGRAVDVLAFTATKSGQNVQDLGTAFSYAGSVARAMGVSIEEAAAVLAVLVKQGIPAGERAGTALRRALSVLLGQTEENEKGLKDLNVTLFDSKGKFVGVAEALRRLQAAGLTAGKA